MFFFILPVGVDYRAKRYPVVTFTLMGICVAVYLLTLALRAANGESVEEWVFENLWLIPAESHWWTYLTSQFVHGGFFHLLGNMMYLFLFGACVEDLLGRWQFTTFYLAGGLVAAFVQILFTPAGFGSEIPFGGASGAISACIGGFVMVLGRTKIEFKWVFVFLIRVFTGEWFIPAWIVISLWFGEDLLGAIETAMSEHERGGVAFAAHVGGFLMGLGTLAFLKWRWRAAEQASEAAELAALAAQSHQRAAETAPEPCDLHLSWDGTTCGPFTASQVRGMLTLGSIPEHASYWQEGMEDWRAIAELRELLGA